MEKLVKYVARVSTYSRRKSEQLIKSGNVRVNGLAITQPSVPVMPGDSVVINEKLVKSEPVPIFIALNKPDGYMSDLNDPRGRKMARDLIRIETKLYPVGRLDYHSEGLMIFTNDGEFANTVMHPRFGIDKEYLVKVKGRLERNDLEKLKQGITIEGQIYRIEGIRKIGDAVRIGAREQKKENFAGKQANVWYSIVINEGKNRMIRKLADAVGHPVLKLKRTRIGKLQLADLEPGKYRYFEKSELLGKQKDKNKKK